MVYEDQPDLNPLGLHLPEMQELAASMQVRPSATLQRHIEQRAEVMRTQASDGTVNPYWLWGEIRQLDRAVTIDQVAWVLVEWVQIRRSR
jgi:hypothetical protein